MQDEQGTTEPTTETTSTAVSSADAASTRGDGTWGERDVGGPVSHREAIEDFEVMRRELSHLSRSRSKSASRAETPRVFRTITGKSNKTTRTATKAEDLEVGDIPDAENEDDFQLGEFMRQGHFERRTTGGESAKKVGVIFKGLTVKGLESSTIYAKTLPDAVVGTFGPDLYKLACRFIPALDFSKQPPLKTLTNDFTGVVRDGEMMLVLGRPGSGCTTFLKAIANKRSEFAALTGQVSYGGISSKEQDNRYRGEVNYNAEEDSHLPTLNVWQTLKFSLLNKTKKREKGEVSIIVSALMKIFGISHTAKTLVGDEMVCFR